MFTELNLADWGHYVQRSVGGRDQCQRCEWNKRGTHTKESPKIPGGAKSNTRKQDPSVFLWLFSSRAKCGVWARQEGNPASKINRTGLKA